MGAVSLYAKERIERIKASAPLVVFMKGDIKNPTCQRSADVANMLTPWADFIRWVDIQRAPEIRAFLPKFSNYSEYPQVYLQGECIGGADVVKDLYEQGELDRMLTELRPAARKAS